MIVPIPELLLPGSKPSIAGEGIPRAFLPYPPSESVPIRSDADVQKKQDGKNVRLPSREKSLQRTLRSEHVISL
jgi:hypothetical protein